MGDALLIGSREVENRYEEAKAALDMVPVLSRIFIHRLRLTRGGHIHIPNTRNSMELSEGIVVASGPDCVLVKPGDHILFGRYAGAEVERNEHTFVLLNEEDILSKKKEDVENG